MWTIKNQRGEAKTQDYEDKDELTVLAPSLKSSAIPLLHLLVFVTILQRVSQFVSAFRRE
jgi:hypothetical protein